MKLYWREKEKGKKWEVLAEPAAKVMVITLLNEGPDGGEYLFECLGKREKLYNCSHLDYAMKKAEDWLEEVIKELTNSLEWILR